MRVLFFLFIFFYNSAFASFEINNRMKQSYNHIINLEFTSASKLLEKEYLENNENRVIVLQNNYIDFLKNIIGEDKDYYINSRVFKRERINFISKGDKESPYYLYSQAEIYLQWSFIYLKNQEYTLFVYDFIKAYNLYNENLKKFPDFILNKKGLSIIHALLGAVPNEYQWMLDIIGLKGDIKSALNEMEEVLNTPELKMYESEMIFILTFLQLNLTNDQEIYSRYLNRIGEAYKNNILLNFAAARLSSSLGMNEYCIEVLENRPRNNNAFSFYYLDYLQAMSYLYKLEFNKSKKYFDLFISNFKGENYIKSSYHKLAWISYLQGNDDYLNYFNDVIKYGNNFIDEDRAALREAVNADITSPILLRSRLLYDGGYYKKSLDEILKLNNQNTPEYYYRLARIQSKLHYNDEIVISNFDKSLNNIDNPKDYYSPMSALQIGLLYEKKSDFDNANRYFKICLSFSDFDYERGIHQQARAALDRISN